MATQSILSTNQLKTVEPWYCHLIKHKKHIYPRYFFLLQNKILPFKNCEHGGKHLVPLYISPREDQEAEQNI
jgi:hypothetical protein